MEVAAGIILYHRTPFCTIVALIQEKNRNGRYDIPGGRKKEDQTILECAITEAQEETRGLIECNKYRIKRLSEIGDAKKFVVFAYELSAKEVSNLNKFHEKIPETDNIEWHETSDLKWVKFNSLFANSKKLLTIDKEEITKTHRLMEISKKLHRLRNKRELPNYITTSLRSSFSSKSSPKRQYGGYYHRISS